MALLNLFNVVFPTEMETGHNDRIDVRVGGKVDGMDDRFEKWLTECPLTEREGDEICAIYQRLVSIISEKQTLIEQMEK
jgi:hypothetical protein